MSTNPYSEEAQTSQVQVDTYKAAEAAKSDLNFLAALADPGSFFFLFPTFYITLFGLLTTSTKKIERFAIGIPRGFAKTTFIKLLCLWYVLFSSKRFILIVSASEKKAINILSDICDFLSSPNIVRIFGNWESHIEVDQASNKVFFFRGREIVLWAAGAQTSVRGINRKNSRPDVMIMDDIQDKEDAKNPELAKELLDWMLSTLMKAKSNFGCTYIFVGNMYPQNSILEKLKNMKYWTSFIVGGITVEGESLWEDLKPIEELLEEYEIDCEAGCPEIFISEVLNSTDVKLASGIDISKLPPMPEYFHGVHGEGSYILIDPSAGKKDSDDLTIGHFSLIDSKSIMDELLADTLTPLETIEKAIEMGLRRNTRLICVEDVAYQSTLLFWFNHYCRVHGIEGFHFLPVSPKNHAKNNRIKAGLVRWTKGEIYVHPKIRSVVIDQVQQWNPLKTNNKDDIIDLLGYCAQVEQQYSEYVIRQILEVDSGQVHATFGSDIEMAF